MLSAAQASQADSIIAQLRAACVKAMADVASPTSWLAAKLGGSESSIDATRSNIAKISDDVELLATLDYVAVQADFEDYSTWYAKANNLFNAIKYQDANVGSWNFSGAVANAISDTGSTLKNVGTTVVNAAEAVLPTLDLLFIAVALLAVAYLVFTFRAA